MDNLGELVTSPAGGSFEPHIITVNRGEDIIMKIVTFARQGQPEDICVLSAVGSISSITLRHPNSSACPSTYEGMFDIVSLSGLFAPSEVGTPAFNSSGFLKVVLARPGGHVFGGALAGRIIADIPVQVVFGSFLRSGHQENFVATETTLNNREEETEADLPLPADCPEQAKK
ncbi:AT-hook motif nuclear-localized protein 1-like [Diospyros lotus]|uniref:AT-hook motif nuclear-localized protein 1-like n=1 Tax=Diospyros lotus TaxID=55363 RepID=UPI00225BCF61|nr:AT-hook motif nuclear-localized protein 1-like [Diospyros lotus]